MSAGLLAITLLSGAPTAQSAPKYQPWGSTSSKNHVLKPGCHFYRYKYVINAPTDEWAAEIDIVNPNGRHLGHTFIDTASDPDRGSLKIKLCRRSTVYGLHKIKMKVTWQRDRENITGHVKPSTFRFTRPAR